MLKRKPGIARQPRSILATRGQAITELALLGPVLILILLAIIEFSGAFQTKMELQAATAQAGRVGAMEGKSSSVDQDMIAAIKATHGIDVAAISQIQIYKAAPDGSVDGTSINTYTPSSSPPFGTCVPSCGWPASTRNTGEPSDSIGVHISYAYRPIIAAPGFPFIHIDDQTVERLNPTQTDYVCPIPGVPVNVGATVVNPQPSTQDTINWDSIPGATEYRVYASVDGAPFMTSPIYDSSGTSATYDRTTTFGSTDIHRYAPTAYEVTGLNSCGEGQRSLPINDGQCPLPTAPSNLTVADAALPGNHDLSWTAVADKPNAYGYYVVTQQVGSNPAITLPQVNAPTTHTTVPYNDPTGQLITYKVWYVSSCNVDGSFGSSPRTSSVTITPIAQPTMTLADTDGQSTVHRGNTLTYQLTYANTASLSTAVATNVKLVDTLDPSVTFSSCNYAAGTCTKTHDSVTNRDIVTIIPGGTVNPGTSTTAQIKVTVQSSATGTIANSAIITYADGNGHYPQTTTANDSPSDSVILAPTMTASESDTTTTTPAYKPGGLNSLTYTITFANTATDPSATAQGVQVIDTFPGAISIDSAVVNTPYGGASCTTTSTTSGGVTTSTTVRCPVSSVVESSHSGTVTIGTHIKGGTTAGTPLTSSVMLTYNDAAGQSQPSFGPISDNHTSS